MAARCSRWAIAHPRRVIAGAALAVAFAAAGLPRLELRADGRSLAPPGDPTVVHDAEVRRHFGLRDPCLVVLETARAGGAYAPAALRRLQGLTAALAALPGIGGDNVVSLATERGDRVYPNTLTFRPLLDPLPTTPARRADLLSTIAAIPALQGTLVSADGRAVAVVVGVPPRGDRGAIYRRLLAAAAPFAAAGDRITVVGAPVAEALLGESIRRDLALLLPLSALAIAAVLWAGCRRLWGVAIGMGEVACCLACTFGLMGWSRTPIDLTTYLLPMIVTLVGVADEVHLIWRYQRVLADAGEDAQAAVAATVDEVMRPVVASSLAALVAFLSFLATEIPAVRTFGLFAAAGIAVAIAYTLLVVPAALALLPPSALARRDAVGAPRPSAALVLAAVLARRRRTHWRAALAVLLLASASLAAGLGRLRVQDSWLDGFAPGSPFRAASARADALFAGTHVLRVEVAFGPAAPAPRAGDRAGPLLDAAALAAVGGLEALLAGEPQVGAVLGPYGELTTVAYLAGGRQPGTRAIPPQPSRIARLLDHFDAVRGLRRRRELIDDELRRTLVTVLLKEANYRDTARLMAAARGDARRRLAPLGARLAFAGDVAVSQAMIPAVVASQITSLAIALCGSFAVVWLVYRSLTAALWATLPPALAALWLLGAMGWAGMPLGVATSMAGALTLGIGVDYGVHFVDRHRAAPALALAVVGREITADVLAAGLGFGLLAFSSIPAVGRLGLLVCAALAASWLLAVVGLPALAAGGGERRA